MAKLEATMREWRRTILLASFGVLLAACGGGSGSTGLITSEGAVIDQVLRDGTCEELDGVSYCATDSPDATAPGGQSVTVGSNAGPTPARTAAPVPTPTAGAADGTTTPTPFAASTPTSIGASGTAAPPTPHGGRTSTPRPAATSTPIPAATSTPIPAATSSPIPAPTASPPAQRSVTAAVAGFDAGAACGTAARAAASADPWRTAPLVAVDPGGGDVTFPIVAGLPAASDLALLCFDDPPSSLPAELTTLADAAPTVVFVLPEGAE